MVDWEAFYQTFREPNFIPGYEIQNHLGGGAYGEVYRLRKSSIGKSFAIKFLRLGEDGASAAVDGELDSVRLFAAIDHPNLVSIEDMGVVQDVPYLIMGYAGEDTLARRLKLGELDTHAALRYFVQSCRGVLALHDRRLAHFDLKPSNIFLRGDVARVGDYGLAKLLTEGRQKLSFSRGTPHYMAPEMLKGQADHRSDIYSLGVILFECFAGHVPFEAQPDGGAVLREDGAPPSFPPGFPDPLRGVVERCLRVDPAKRFDSISDLLASLGQTARQGDSVRLRYEELSAQTRELQGRQPLTQRGRQRAVERAQDEGEPPEPKPPAVPSTASDVVAMQTLDQAENPSSAELEEAASAPALAEAEPAWRRELQRGRGELEDEPEPASSAAGFATVPVPPASEGGLFGSVMQSLAVGIEIMASLFTGPILAGTRGVLRTTDRLLKGVPGPLEWFLRLCLMVLFMCVLGGLVAAIMLIALPMNPE